MAGGDEDASSPHAHGGHTVRVVATRDLILDQYAPLSHKKAIGVEAAPGTAFDDLAPMWVPLSERRRLTVYKVLLGYLLNASRLFLHRVTTIGDDDRREYGDARLLVDRTVAGVIGEDWQIVVDGADDDLADEPDLPDRPDPPPAPPPDAPPADPAASSLDERIRAARMARWVDQATAAVDEWEQAWATQPELQARQDWLRQWADDEFFSGKLQEAEQDAVGLGDGVYVLGLGDSRVTVTVYEPGFYFPVLDDQTDGFPDRVHIAWEFETDDGKHWVRRLTWELVPVSAALFDDTLQDFPRNDDGTVQLAPDVERINPDTGEIERLYPWARDENGNPLDPDNPDWSPITCLYSDGTWELKDLEARKVDDFADQNADWVARDVDLRCDFIPVVHVPNTPATKEHFGQSILLAVAQLLDDLSASDTDREAARALASTPAVALAGGQTDTITSVRPGVVWNLPDGGRMDVLDLTAGLEQLRLEGESMLDRLNVNSRIPAEVVGRIKDSSGDLSGVAIALRLGPFRQLLGQLRLPREQKLPLLLKFQQRLAQVGGWLPDGENPVARVRFGSSLPSDLKAAVEMAVALLTAHGVSRRTALAMLVDAGVDIGDVVDELDRIREDDTAGAFDVFRATGSEELAAERLGEDLPPAPAPPTVMPGRGNPPVPTLPPVPGGPPAPQPGGQ